MILNKIPILDIYITGNCNYCCNYCFGENITESDISLDFFQKILDLANFLETSISFTGGEPLLHKNIDLLIEKSRSSNIEIALRTNGMFLKEFIDLTKYFSLIGVSLDGAYNMNDQMRPNNKMFNFSKEDKVNIPLSNIDLLRSKNKHQIILLSSLVSSYNSDSLLELAKNINEKNITIDKWKLYQFTRNNFRSITASKEFETNKNCIKTLKNNLKKYFTGKIITKVGSGNCIIIDTKGNIRVNDIIFANINDKFIDIKNKILTLNLLKEINKNKIDTIYE
jgi:MoaA/NifB/PqqE/SkfB family radical SAM enzyme